MTTVATPKPGGASAPPQDLPAPSAPAGSLPSLTVAEMHALVSLLVVIGRASEADLAPWRLLVSLLPWWESATGQSAWGMPAAEVMADVVRLVPTLATDERVHQAAAELGRIIPLLSRMGR